MWVIRTDGDEPRSMRARRRLALIAGLIDRARRYVSAAMPNAESGARRVLAAASTERRCRS